MKKKSTGKTKEIILILVVVLIIIAVIVTLLILRSANAEDATRVLKEQTTSDIKYDDKKLNVYMFWGDGSEQSEQMIEFLNSLDATYDRYFDLYTLEVWYDEDNRNLQQELLTQIGEDTNGVPCLIIGDQAFFGYDETLEEDIKAAIKEEYLKVPQYDAYKTYTS